MFRHHTKNKPPPLNPKHELAVLLPFQPGMKRASGQDHQFDHLPVARIRGIHLMWLFLIFAASAFAAGAQTGTEKPSTVKTILAWTPLLLKGFGFNILISFMSMAIGSATGSVLGVLQISLLPPVRLTSRFLTQFFRNSPWLVLLFYCMFMLPFELTIGELRIPFPDWIKAVIGLSLPVMANVAEIVRGAVNSIPSGQWEASESLAFNRLQQIWLIILPQC